MEFGVTSVGGAEGVTFGVRVTPELEQETFTSDTLSSITQYMSLSLSLSLFCSLTHTREKKLNWDGRVFFQREIIDDTNNNNIDGNNNNDSQNNSINFVCF